MFEIRKRFVLNQNNLYEVVKIFPQEDINSVEAVRDYYGCNMVFNMHQKLVFCKLVEEAEIVTEDTLSLQ